MAFSSGDIAPSPNRTMGCQDLLKEGACIHSGWLRRQSLRNRFRIFSWPQVYVVISGGCVYCYSSEVGKKPASAFSLYGYDRVFRAGEVSEKEAMWSFKLVHVNQDYRSYLFSASSEKEMLYWMNLFKQEMLRANGKLPRSQGDGFDVSFYQDSSSQYSGSVTSAHYKDIEASIYEDSSLCVLPTNYTNKKEEEDSDEEMDQVVTTRPDLQERPPQPPPVPRRPPKTMSSPEATLQGMVAVTVEPKQMQPKKNQSAVRPVPEQKLKDIEKQDVRKDSKPLRSRGCPDGSSVKKDQGNSAVDDFWSTIFFYGGKEKAAEIIRQMPDEGVYLVRVNDDKSMVLHVYANETGRKFQIFKVGDKYTLKKDSLDHFSRVEELVYYYYSKPLPNLDTCLTECYNQNPRYSQLHF